MATYNRRTRTSRGTQRTIGPNPGHRIGWTRVWDDQPFYWVSPSGDSRVLCWFSGKSYNWFHTGLVYDRETLPNKLTEDRIADYLLELEDYSEVDMIILFEMVFLLILLSAA